MKVPSHTAATWHRVFPDQVEAARIPQFHQCPAQWAGGHAAPGLRLAMLGGVGAFATAAPGALPAPRCLSQCVEESLLGTAAAMMLAAHAFPHRRLRYRLPGRRGISA